MEWLQRWFGLRFPNTPSQPCPRRRCRPAVESLEGRALPTVTYHGGPVLANVEVEALFLGADWSTDPTLSGQAQQLTVFLQYITNSPFMDTLNRAGYGVGRGSFLDASTASIPLPSVLDDSAIQLQLSAAITAGSLQAPNANRLYFVFVPPSVVVTYAGENSVAGFFGYHDDYTGPGGAVIPYAVVTYPGLLGGNYPKLSAFETMTKTAAHELAESVTDPQGGQVGRLAWVDLSWKDPNTGRRGGEIADITNDRIVDLNGYVIQAVADRHDRPMIPAGASWDPRFRPRPRGRHTDQRRRKHHRHPIRRADHPQGVERHAEAPRPATQDPPLETAPDWFAVCS
jgi:hypothetical protein